MGKGAQPGNKHFKFVDLTGQKFGRLAVLFRMAGRLHGGIPWLCRCDCGQFRVVNTANLRGGNTSSCGCAGREKTIKRNFKHGLTKTVEYTTWNHIITRCENPNRPEYPNYGGRGIRMCSRWRHGEDGKTGFECFLADVGNRPSALFSIERIDPNGHYEPGNVKWATRAEQAVNKRRNLFLEVNGERVLASKYAEMNGISASAFQRRVRQLGWDLERAATTPVVRWANQTTYSKGPT